MRSVLITLVTATLCSSFACAAPRTTPTTVENSPTVKVDSTANTVKIDSTANAVKAAQNGVWTIGVNSLPTVNVSTHAVSQHGTWNVGILGTANTVKTPTQSQKIQLWATNQNLIPGSGANSPNITTTGYRLAHVVLRGNWVGPLVHVWVYVLGGDGVYQTLGTADFEVAATSIVNGGNFQMSGAYCVFTVPVISDSMYFRVTNDQVTQTAIIYDWSYVYLTN